MALARASGDDAVLAAALAAYCDVIAGPDDSERRIDLSTEIVQIAQRHRNRPLELLGRVPHGVGRCRVAGAPDHRLR